MFNGSKVQRLVKFIFANALSFELAVMILDSTKL